MYLFIYTNVLLSGISNVNFYEKKRPMLFDIFIQINFSRVYILSTDVLCVQDTT